MARGRDERKGSAPNLSGFSAERSAKNTYQQQYLEERITREELDRKEQRAGKIAIVTNTDIEPSEVYEVVDQFCNHLLVQHTYARTDEQIQGWI